MNNILFSDEFKKFWSYINDDYDNMNVFFSRLHKAMPFIADSLCIGRLSVSFSCPNIYTKSVNSVSKEIYSSLDGYIDIPITKKYTTVDKATFTIQICPCAGEIWTDTIKEQLLYFIDVIFKLGSRVHITSAFEKSMYMDNQTGIYNAAGLTKFATNLSMKGEFYKYTSLYLNIKNFRYINKSYGYRIGDKVLIAYGHNLTNFIGDNGIIAHLGGDNFFVLIKDDIVNAFLKHISSLTISLDYTSGARSFELSTCAGIYSIEVNSTVGDMMNNANIAYKAAKESIHKTYMTFSADMLTKIMHKKEVLSLFPKALDNNEFVIYYQPKVNMVTNEICGTEALVRWIKNGKIIPPLDFIPILEDEGNICLLDFYVFEQACHDIRAWLNMGIEPVRVSTNFSRINLKDIDFAGNILSIIKKYDIDSKYIEVELTEITNLDSNEEFINFLAIMKKNNICVSIDDFGSGYSSLKLLKDLDVDMIKLDKSFVNDKDNRTKNEETVVKNIVNLISELGIEVIAEGVETQEQKDFLKGVNCMLAQGYLYDKPMPREDFERKLINDRIYKLN